MFADEFSGEESRDDQAAKKFEIEKVYFLQRLAVCVFNEHFVDLREVQLFGEWLCYGATGCSGVPEGFDRNKWRLLSGRYAWVIRCGDFGVSDDLPERCFEVRRERDRSDRRRRRLLFRQSWRWDSCRFVCTRPVRECSVGS